MDVSESLEEAISTLPRPCDNFSKDLSENPKVPFVMV